MALQVRETSKRLFERAALSIPGGVNSPVRAFKAVGTHPVFVERALGSKIYDVDGNEYIDYVASYGPLILGHSHPEVVEAVQRAARGGTSFGAPTEGEIALAEEIKAALPSIERVRLVNSGTEATMSALRLARAATGRSKIVKFAGCYHGHVDSLLIQAGSGAATLGVPSSPGVTAAQASETLIVPYNDLAAVEALFDREGDAIAAVIVEPVAGNMSVVPPRPGFLAGLRALTKQHGALLIFDEVITGFRLTYGGAQTLYGIEPDLTCLGKIIGGGLPVGAYGGRADLMDQMAPGGPVYQAGTLSGNPLCVAAGRATLAVLKREGERLYQELDRRAALLCQTVEQAAREAGVPFTTTRVGSLCGWFFTDAEVRDYASVTTADTEGYATFFRKMLSLGVYLAPSQFEAVFLSAAHSDLDLERTVEAARASFKEVAKAKE